METDPGESDRASEYDDMSVDEYAGNRGIQLVKQSQTKGKENENGSSRADQETELQDTIDSAVEILNGAYPYAECSANSCAGERIPTSLPLIFPGIVRGARSSWRSSC